MRRRLVFLAVVASAPLACSLLVDTSGLAGDPLEASTDAPSLEEATTMTDGAASDAPLADAAHEAAAPCVVTDTRFCDDFDEDPDGGRWDNSLEMRGSLAFDGMGLSPPDALVANIGAGSDFGAAGLYKQLSSRVPASVHCELDLRADAVAPKGEVDVFYLITSRDGQPDHTVYLATFDGQPTIAEYQAATDAGAKIDNRQTILGAVPVASWVHVVVDYSSSSFEVSIEGIPTVLTGLKSPSTGRRVLGVGIPYASGMVQAATVRVDNVDCTTTL